ncbi:unnamed protein product [Mytilus coruscus]|uniref:Uncharacterized protein n=1 Tax=Mytilus coruscus TaxID=42192 RepID=A0A6J8E5C8_MYTCO|nr:unnamed protein product [Mytilus coruscus]
MEFENITKFASKLQTFLGMREIQSKVTDNESCLKSMVANKYVENIDIQFTIDEKEFETACYLPSGCCKTRTQTGGYFFTGYGIQVLKLAILNAQAEIEDVIMLKRLCCAFDVEFINDNRVAVSTGKPDDLGKEPDLGIRIFDLTRRQVTQFIELPGCSYGITYDGISLICCVLDKDIHVISCKDYSITKIPKTVTTESSYVSTHADKIVYTNPEENKVSC